MADMDFGRLTTQFYNEIFSAVEKHRAIAIEKDGAGQWQVKKRSLLHRILHRGNSKYHLEQACRTAAVFAGFLQDFPRMDLQAAGRDRRLAVIRAFLKEEPIAKAQDRRVMKLRKECLAAKLGIASAVFDANPGFQEFVQKSYLERYLLTYGHTLRIDPSDQKVNIMKDFTLQPWDRVWTEFKALPKSQRRPSQPWMYGPSGVQHKDMYDWAELRPFMRGNPAEWGHQYIFEYCAGCTDVPRMTGDHSWFRLKTPEGDIYSVGLYRPEKVSKIDKYKFPFRVKEGFLMSPDVSEFWPYDTLSIPIAITRDQFMSMKSAIEEDKRKDEQTFQLFQRNCTLYCHKIAALGGIRLPTAEAALRMLVAQKTQRAADKVINTLPKGMRSFLEHAQAVYVNILQLFLGAAYIDPALARKMKGRVYPHIRSVGDLFKISKSELNHPFTLGRKTRLQVLEWRKQETAKLEEQKKSIEQDLQQGHVGDRYQAMAQIEGIRQAIVKTRFGLPPAFRQGYAMA